jgi:WD40 repeat protein
MLGKALQLAAAGNAGNDTWPDISTASFVRFDTVVAGNDVRGVFFKPDGTKIYTCEFGDYIRQATLSTAWDISTHGTADYSMLTDQNNNGNPAGIFIGNDGTELYVTELSLGDHVVQYTMSTAWDLSTASYTRKFDVETQETRVRGVSFSEDGTLMFINGGSTDINKYTLSTAWDISTATHSQTSSSYNSLTTAALGMFIKPDGTRFYLVDSANDKLYQWNMTTAYDITGDIGVTTDDDFSTASQETTPWCMYISPDGNHLYVGGGTDNGIDQYSLG